MNSKHSRIISLISRYISLEETDIDLITQVFEPISVRKNTLLEDTEKIVQNLYFINNGFVRTYYMDNGEDKTTQINCPSGFITCFESFNTRTKAFENVETVTDCELLQITKSNLENLRKKIKKWRVFEEKVFEQLLIFNEQRNRDMIILTAKERYLKLIENQIDIAKNIPLQYIASFIGIKPESLSRIRRNLVS
ncbi:Crp/Fnr family transcriptional regulator [Sinomicrobium soli]|uniref:Crp/Fnr family transcriptional regulator n=1 Tax=Sinomicrobium sp. N-1-3-6 TaxID=2219864 RepID=UPI000DCBF637|nr:Crp/Fnr family transcriptional regulator [Sinomicrobium sp. N-1-3-6]RAV27779.1 Crp/Fnr family transcriptional regulator [Sinomicrobium sp. N-1-3-6]